MNIDKVVVANIINIMTVVTTKIRQTKATSRSEVALAAWKKSWENLFSKSTTKSRALGVRNEVDVRKRLGA